MALKYGFDISNPASNAKEAVQWLYFGYLGAIKDQNGAAMSIGRTSTFLDIYFERDLKNGIITIIGTRIILKIVSLFAKFMSILLYYLCSLSIICIH